MSIQSWHRHILPSLFLPKPGMTVLFFQRLDWTNTQLGVGFGQSLSVWQPWTDRKGLQSSKMAVPKCYGLESSKENCHLYMKQLVHSEVRKSAEFLDQNKCQVVDINFIWYSKLSISTWRWFRSCFFPASFIKSLSNLDWLDLVWNHLISDGILEWLFEVMNYQHVKANNFPCMKWHFQ